MTNPDGNSSTPSEGRDDTDLLERAKAVVVNEQAVSISLLQRRLLIGYSVALKVMAELEQAGVVTATNAEGVRTLTSAYQHSRVATDAID